MAADDTPSHAPCTLCEHDFDHKEEGGKIECRGRAVFVCGACKSVLYDFVVIEYDMIQRDFALELMSRASNLPHAISMVGSRG